MSRYIDINKIKKFTLFSHICLKKSVCFTSCQVSEADTGDNYCVDGGPLTLPYLTISVNDRVITLFREGLIFTKVRICEVSRKLNSRENFQIYSSKQQLIKLT